MKFDGIRIGDDRHVNLKGLDFFPQCKYATETRTKGVRVRERKKICSFCCLG